MKYYQNYDYNEKKKEQTEPILRLGALRPE